MTLRIPRGIDGEPMMHMDVLEVTFQGIRPNKSIERTIRERIRWLEGYHSEIASCRVVVGPLRGRPRSCDVTVGVALAIRRGPRFVVSHEAAVPGPVADDRTSRGILRPDRCSTELAASLAVHEAFDAMMRCLQEFTSVRDGRLTVQ